LVDATVLARLVVALPEEVGVVPEPVLLDPELDVPLEDFGALLVDFDLAVGELLLEEGELAAGAPLLGALSAVADGAGSGAGVAAGWLAVWSPRSTLTSPLSPPTVTLIAAADPARAQRTATSAVVSRASLKMPGVRSIVRATSPLGVRLRGVTSIGHCAANLP
jgi:hypothetical protein